MVYNFGNFMINSVGLKCITIYNKNYHYKLIAYYNDNNEINLTQYTNYYKALYILKFITYVIFDDVEKKPGRPKIKNFSSYDFSNKINLLELYLDDIQFQLDTLEKHFSNVVDFEDKSNEKNKNIFDRYCNIKVDIDQNIMSFIDDIKDKSNEEILKLLKLYSCNSSEQFIDFIDDMESVSNSKNNLSSLPEEKFTFGFVGSANGAR